MTKSKSDAYSPRKVVLSVTVDPDVWEKSKDRAIEENRSLSSVVEKLLKAYGNVTKKK